VKGPSDGYVGPWVIFNRESGEVVTCPGSNKEMGVCLAMAISKHGFLNVAALHWDTRLPETMRRLSANLAEAEGSVGVERDKVDLES